MIALSSSISGNLMFFYAKELLQEVNEEGVITYTYSEAAFNSMMSLRSKFKVVAIKRATPQAKKKKCATKSRSIKLKCQTKTAL